MDKTIIIYDENAELLNNICYKREKKDWRMMTAPVVALLILCIVGLLFSAVRKGEFRGSSELNSKTISQTNSDEELASTPNKLIRFHVIANSDSDQDQALKRAVRDAILEKVSPKLASSHTLDESRQILQSVRSEMEDIGKSVVKSWGKDYTVRTEYGHFSFPTKSYGSLILPAGDYEALRVVIGKGSGSNWWCVLFPPLCFIDIEHSTAVQVDGKPGIPINTLVSVNSTKQTVTKTEKNIETGQNRETGENKEIIIDNNNSQAGSIKVRYYFWELVAKLLF
jgi:stage II sporulation protein R